MTSAVDKIKARHADLGAASEAFAKAGGDPAKMVMPRPTPQPAPSVAAATLTTHAPVPESVTPSVSAPQRVGRKAHVGAGEPVTTKLAYAQIDGLNELRLEAESQVRRRRRIEVADIIRLAVDELLARPRADQLKAIERAMARR